MASTEEHPQEEPAAAGECVLHRTKTIRFFGRSTPIVLQNDNGPCPLLAICNVLLLKNQLNLSPGASEVSQEKLLSLVADKLLDSNSNVKNKELGYIENQRQNIADAINLLPQLKTGIDVNIKFRRIDDFEFTKECALFDLLDISLYHGWLVDPQDHETAEAIGSKSYNTIMSDLVSLEARKMKDEAKDKVDEDCIDFAAATTATLGVPSPSLSRAKSFDESLRSVSNQAILMKGDAEEEAELQRALKLSNNEAPHVEDNSGATATSGGDPMMDSDKDVCLSKTSPEKPLSIPKEYNSNGSLDVEPSISGSCDVSGNCNRNVLSQEETAGSLSSRNAGQGQSDQLDAAPSVEGFLSNDLARYPVDTMVNEAPSSSSLVKDMAQDQAVEDELHKLNGGESSTVVAVNSDSHSSSGRIPSIEAIDSFNASLDGSEPIYEGEECIQDSRRKVYEEGEPVYEGEVVLAEQADKGTKDVDDARQKDEITLRHGELISNFLKSNMSQLTFYGLFSLQEGLKERELCIFFRNNHFSTMFKFEGELYLLATDQGFMNQPDLVWEKLNQVNGDTLFVTSNFKEFSLESKANGIWDQQNAVATTADYLASINRSVQASSSLNPDLQLAIALQQQEFEQQPQRHAPQQPSSNGSSRLVTGPQVRRSSGKATSSSVREEQKSKEKSSNCKLM